jgi:hypothetical protein
VAVICVAPGEGRGRVEEEVLHELEQQPRVEHANAAAFVQGGLREIVAFHSYDRLNPAAAFIRFVASERRCSWRARSLEFDWGARVVRFRSTIRSNSG